jgi:Ca2+-binding EF-hand superfamily protein
MTPSTRTLLLSSLLLAGGAQAQQPATPAAGSTPRPATAAAAKAAPATASQAARGAASPERMFADWDRDKNRQLSLDEFRTGMEEARTAQLIGQLSQQFGAVDDNRNGLLEAAEYAKLPAIRRAGPAAPPFATFDADKNQALDFKEYMLLFQAMMARGKPR